MDDWYPVHQCYFSAELDYIYFLRPPERTKICLSVLHRLMEGRSLKKIRDELERLMLEQIQSLRMEAFGGLSEEELRQQKERLTRIREVSADYLSALKNELG